MVTGLVKNFNFFMFMIPLVVSFVLARLAVRSCRITANFAMVWGISPNITVLRRDRFAVCALGF